MATLEDYTCDPPTQQDMLLDAFEFLPEHSSLPLPPLTAEDFDAQDFLDLDFTESIGSLMPDLDVALDVPHPVTSSLYMDPLTINLEAPSPMDALGLTEEELKEAKAIPIGPPAEHVPDYYVWQKDMMYEEVQGPKRLIRMYLGPKNDPTKIIYLFGDIHTFLEPTACEESIRIDNYIMKWLREAPYRMDFILETYSVDMDDIIIISHLGQLRSIFGNYFQREKKEDTAVMGGVRFHMNDWRFERRIFKEFETKYHKQRYFMDQVYWNKKFRRIFKVNKQLQHCSLDVQRIINKWINDQVALLPDATMLDNSDYYTSKHRDYLIEYSIIFMDAYTVARMFRTFTQQEDEYAGEMRNIIVYTGDFHTENYIQLLRLLGCIVEQISATYEEIIFAKPKGGECYTSAQCVSGLMCRNQVCTGTHKPGTDRTQCLDMNPFLPLTLVPDDDEDEETTEEE